MCFSDYKILSQVQREYQIKYAEAIFAPRQEVALSATFIIVIVGLTRNLNIIAHQ